VCTQIKREKGEKISRVLDFFLFQNRADRPSQKLYTHYKKINKRCLTQLYSSTWKSAANRPGESR
jgi:hypothetical protein